jgi:hypothetical protein
MGGEQRRRRDREIALAGFANHSDGEPHRLPSHRSVGKRACPQCRPNGPVLQRWNWRKYN